MQWIEARPIIALRLGISEEELGLVMDELFEEVEPEDEVRIHVQDVDFVVKIDGASFDRFRKMVTPFTYETVSDIIVSPEGIGFTRTRKLWGALAGVDLRASMVDGPVTGPTIRLSKIPIDDDMFPLKQPFDRKILPSDCDSHNSGGKMDVEDLWYADSSFSVNKPVVFMKNLKTASATTSRIKFIQEDGKVVMICSNGGITGEVFRVIYDGNEAELNHLTDDETEAPSFDTYAVNKILQPTCRKGELNLLVLDHQLIINHRSGTKEPIWMSASVNALNV